MKGAVRIFVVATLLVLQQAFVPLLGSAQRLPDDVPVPDDAPIEVEDPCEELEPSLDPSPDPSPSPAPTHDPDEEDGEQEDEEGCEEHDGSAEEEGEDAGDEAEGDADQGDADGGQEDDDGLDVTQVDPCEPVPIPDLCQEEGDPSPSPSPSPGDGSGKDDGGKGGGGKGGGKGGGQDGGSTGGGTKKGKTGGSRADRSDRDAPGGSREGDRDVEASPAFFLGGPQNTARLVKILTELTQYGVPLRRSLLTVVGPFPVAGLAWWTDDWHACRDGCDRLHKGLDIFARDGTPVVAAADGVISQKGEADLAGLYVEITDDDGVEYFYAHLSDWADDIEVGTEVEVGDVLGYVGNTGNAVATPPHLHFEYQPDGVPAPPKPLVDRWLRIAERRALELVREHEGEEPISLEDLDAFRLARLFDLGGQGPAGEGSGSELLLLAGLQPAASSFEMARRTLDRMAWEIDWSEQIDAELARLLKEYERAAAEERLLGGPLLAGTRPEAPGEQLDDGAELGD